MFLIDMIVITLSYLFISHDGRDQAAQR